MIDNQSIFFLSNPPHTKEIHTNNYDIFLPLNSYTINRPALKSRR